MCFRIAKQGFPIEYVPTVFDNYEYGTSVGGTSVGVQIWDTAGGEGNSYSIILKLTIPYQLEYRLW